MVSEFVTATAASVAALDKALADAQGVYRQACTFLNGKADKTECRCASSQSTMPKQAAGMCTSTCARGLAGCVLLWSVASTKHVLALVILLPLCVYARSAFFTMLTNFAEDLAKAHEENEAADAKVGAMRTCRVTMRVAVTNGSTNDPCTRACLLVLCSANKIPYTGIYCGPGGQLRMNIQITLMCRLRKHLMHDDPHAQAQRLKEQAAARTPPSALASAAKAAAALSKTPGSDPGPKDTMLSHIKAFSRLKPEERKTLLTEKGARQRMREQQITVRQSLAHLPRMPSTPTEKASPQPLAGK